MSTLFQQGQEKEHHMTKVKIAATAIAGVLGLAVIAAAATAFLINKAFDEAFEDLYEV
jgi:hypothetical protein